jgi:hypothetical protein
MTDEARVVAPDRLCPGDLADRSGDLLSITSGPDSTIVSLYMRLE